MSETTIDQLAAAPDQGAATAVDVREPAQFQKGQVPGAVNISTSRLTARVDEIDRDRSVHVVCAPGNRSSAMVDVLTANGFEAHNIAGGTGAWTVTGRPSEKGGEDD
jgi:rhodanese-related sulfurtransferase